MAKICMMLLQINPRIALILSQMSISRSEIVFDLLAYTLFFKCKWPYRKNSGRLKSKCPLKFYPQTDNPNVLFKMFLKPISKKWDLWRFAPSCWTRNVLLEKVKAPATPCGSFWGSQCSALLSWWFVSHVQRRIVQWFPKKKLLPKQCIFNIAVSGPLLKASEFPKMHCFLSCLSHPDKSGLYCWFKVFHKICVFLYKLFKLLNHNKCKSYLRIISAICHQKF